MRFARVVSATTAGLAVLVAQLLYGILPPLQPAACGGVGEGETTGSRAITAGSAEYIEWAMLLLVCAAVRQKLWPSKKKLVAIGASQTGAKGLDLQEGSGMSKEEEEEEDDDDEGEQQELHGGSDRSKSDVQSTSGNRSPVVPQQPGGLYREMQHTWQRYAPVALPAAGVIVQRLANKDGLGCACAA